MIYLLIFYVNWMRHL